MANGCWGAVRQLTIDGEPMPTSYSQYTWGGSTYSTFKATKINMPRELASGMVICLTLDPSCPTLNDFCYGTGPGVSGCQYSYFNTDQTCCPTSWMPSFVVPSGYPEIEIPPQFMYPVDAYYMPQHPGEVAVSVAQAQDGGA
eukprot:360058-Chlamydomonas_euryale.AAC.1